MLTDYFLSTCDTLNIKEDLNGSSFDEEFLSSFFWFCRTQQKKLDW